jgi:ABC-type multidrug transport system fused ATPase/permease subunit
VGIVGDSGSGKTTLIDIFLGLLKPQKGKILVDGVDISENLKSFQSLIGYVPQDVYLLDDSLKRNIAFGKKEDEIDNEMITETIKISQLDDVVNKLSNGLNSNVGERGSKFSGGEKQRIGIARSLYNKPKILVLDEATSSLDLETEKNFINSIHELKDDKTILIISHRESTLQNCDIIYEISQGKLNLKRKK